MGGVHALASQWVCCKRVTVDALAAVAVAGAASAQVTLSGEAGFAFVSDNTTSTGANGNTVAKAKTDGLAQTDGSVTLSASEDLGGGMKVMASHTFDLKGRSSVKAENSTITVAGGFGSIMIGALEAGNGILGLGGGGAPGRGLDNGTALDGGSNVDLIKYTTPALIPGLTASLSRAEGLGAGDGAAQTTGVGLNYSAGALTVAFDNTSYSWDTAAAAVVGAVNAACANDTTGSRAGDAPAFGTACADGTTLLSPGVEAKTAAEALAARTDSRQRLSASYDLGVAKVGFGYQLKSYNGAGKDNKQTVVGVSAPLGAFTVGVAMSSNKTDGSAKTKGTDFGVNYALSKRTALNLSRMSTKADGSASNTFTRVRLLTKF